MSKLVRLIFVILLATGAHLTCAQEDRKLPTVGLAIPIDSTSDAPFNKAFRQGLRDLGWIDGRNIVLVARYANGDPARYREIVRELLALQVDVLWGEARELSEATKTIPIVSPTMDWGDPVRTGLVASLARPGGNLTGPSTQRHDIRSKATPVDQRAAAQSQTALCAV